MQLSVRNRMTAMVMIATLISLVLGMGSLSLQQVRALERHRQETTEILAEVIGHTAVTSLAFDDPEDARQVLARLRQFPEVQTATIFDRDGEQFAQYLHAQTTDQNVPHTIVKLPLRHAGADYGVIQLRVSTADVQRDIRDYLVQAGLIAALVTAVAIVVALSVQRVISRRLADLTIFAERVAKQENTQLRTDVGGSDEIGVLARGFNTMMARLDQRADDLQATAARLQSLIESSPTAIIVTDAHGKIVIWNNGAERIFGHPAMQALGRAAVKLLPMALAEQIEAIAGQAHSTSTAEIEYTRVGDGRDAESNEERVHLRATAAVLGGDAGSGVICIVMDESEAHRARAALRDRDLQLQRAERMEAVGRLASGVSHDFNNLLTVIVANGELVKQQLSRSESVDDMAQDCVRDILHAAQRGAALTHRLLAFAGHRESAPEVFDIGATLDNLWRMIRSVLGENVQAELDAGPHALFACIDVAQFEQVVLNLVLNARDAMPGGGSLTITLSDTHDPATTPDLPNTSIQWLSVRVKDTGTGMSDKVLARIFNPFFTTKVHGTGLGLATARKMLRDSGADLAVTSTVGEGSVFTIWLPAASGAKKDPNTDSETELLTGTEHILLVEDQSDLRSVSCHLLERQGYTVTSAADGVDALELYHQHPGRYQMLVTDVVMPRLGGIPLARTIKSDDPDFPVLFVSGYVDDEQPLPGLDASMALLAKPFMPNVWLAKIRELLDNRDKR